MRFIGVPFLAAITWLMNPTGAAAATVPTLTVDPAYGPPLAIVKVIGHAFCSTCGPVTITVSSLAVDQAAVQPDGGFSKLIRIPGSARPGPVLVGAAQGGGRPALATFTVSVSVPAPKTYPTPSSVPPPGNLPPPPHQSSTQAPSSSTPPSTAAPPTSAPSSTEPSAPVTAVLPTSGSASPAAATHRTQSGANWPAILAGLGAVLVVGAGATYAIIRRRRTSPN